MNDTRTLTIETESAGSYADATEETLDRLLHQMSKANSYLILHRTDRPEEEYAQTAIERRPDGKLVEDRVVVEYRDGPHSHHQAVTSDLELVRTVLSGWAFDRPGWKDLLTWKPLDLGF